jgi:hypothetical protein
MRRVVAAIALFALVAPASTLAQDDGGVFGVIIGFGGGFHERSRWDMNVRYEGGVVVRYSGRGESGTIVWTPGRRGQMTAAHGVDSDGKPAYQAYLGPTGGQITAAQITRGGRLCSDRTSPDLEGAAVTSRRNGIELALAGNGRATSGFSLTETNCGGPLSGSLAQVLRPVSINAAELKRGHFDIDLRTSGAFADGELKGTVESTLVAHVGRRQREPREDPSVERHRRRYRTLEVDYRIERVSGTVAASFTGGELCEELASCDSTAGWLLRTPSGRGFVSSGTSMPVARPEVDLLTAAGLSKDGDARGIEFGGGGGWTTATATLKATSSGPGEQPCSDKRKVSGASLQFDRRGASMLVSAYTGFDAIDRTSCPGPGLNYDPARSLIATARVPVAAFARRRVTIHLKSGEPVETDGWRGATKPDLTLVLKRERVKTTIERF